MFTFTGRLMQYEGDPSFPPQCGVCVYASFNDCGLCDDNDTCILGEPCKDRPERRCGEGLCFREAPLDKGAKAICYTDVCGSGAFKVTRYHSNGIDLKPELLVISWPEYQRTRLALRHGERVLLGWRREEIKGSYFDFVGGVARLPREMIENVKPDWL
jgi:hypothetical protein